MNYHVPMYIALTLGVVLIIVTGVRAYRNQRDAAEILTTAEIRAVRRAQRQAEAPAVDQEAA